VSERRRPGDTGFTHLVVYRDDDGFAVRAWRITRVGPVRGAASPRVESLQAARALVPAGMVRLERSPGDDPTIVETWT